MDEAALGPRHPEEGHRPMALLIIGLLLFLATHLVRVLAPGFRTASIARFGKPVWMGLHSVTSILSIVVLAYGFDAARETTGMLYNTPAWMPHLTALLMLFAMILLAAGLLPAGHIAVKTKHPILTAVKLWAVAHLLSNGETASVLLFVTLLAWAVIVRIAIKRRARAGEVTERAFAGAQWDVFAVILGVAATVAMIGGLHEWLIGVAPLTIS